MKKIKEPRFTSEHYSSTIGSYIVAQKKLGNAPSMWKIEKQWKRLQRHPDELEVTNLKGMCHNINVYFGLKEDFEAPIVAVYSEATKNIVFALYYGDMLVSLTDVPVATLVYPTKVWTLKDEKEIHGYHYFDWKGNEHIEGVNDNVFQQKVEESNTSTGSGE